MNFNNILNGVVKLYSIIIQKVVLNDKIEMSMIDKILFHIFSNVQLCLGAVAAERRRRRRSAGPGLNQREITKWN